MLYGNLNSKFRMTSSLLNIFLVFYIVLFSSSPLFAQSSNNAGDILGMEEELSENAFNVSTSLDNRTKLMLTYEKMVLYNCMPNLLVTLDYHGNADNSRCQEYIDKLLNLVPEDPVAICA